MDDEPLPHWPAGTVAILATADAAPHAIPVSTVLRVDDRTLVLALGARRGSLERLRTHPRVAVTVLAGGDVAFTAHGAARVAADPLPGLDGVVGVLVMVERFQSHRRATFTIDAGVAWRWADEDARDRDEAVRAALAGLAPR